jgi:hypothetical protein
VLPTAALLAGLALLRRGRYRQLRRLADLLLRGGAWGLAATLLYDAVRPAIRLVFGYAYDPYRAMPIFGQLITGQTDTPLALAAGWIYHFWNGISFGMIFALLRPRGGALAGLAWGVGLQVLMMITYPTLLRIRLEDPGFLVSGLVGHGVWGLALGAGLRRGAGVEAHNA